MFDDANVEQLLKDMIAIFKAHNDLVDTVNAMTRANAKTLEDENKNRDTVNENGKAFAKRHDNAERTIAELEATVKKLTARLSYLETMYNKMKK